MPVSWMSDWVIKKIDGIRRSFLWKEKGTINGGHCLVSWKKVWKGKSQGGLGVKDMKDFNVFVINVVVKRS